MTRRTVLLSAISAALAPLAKFLPTAKAAPVKPAPNPPDATVSIVIVRISGPAKGGGKYYGTLVGSEVHVLAIDFSAQSNCQRIIDGTQLVGAYTGYVIDGLPIYRVFTTIPLR